MEPEEKAKLDRMFQPRGVALYGGAGKVGSFGNLILLSQQRYGYKGKLYPISSKGGEVAGLKVYKSLAEVDGPVDLASISVPAKAVPAVLRECLEHGVAGAQVHSSGFGELGEAEGAALQDELAEIAKAGIRVIGPNCFGLHSPKGEVTLLPGSDFSKTPGSTAFISQSGGAATDFGYEALAAGLRISKIISFGNGVDLDAASLLDYLADDPDTGEIGMYLEGVKDADYFFRMLKKAASRKPVVIWKAGLTPLGGRAAKSHTGSLAGQAEIWEGVIKQAGAVMVQGLDELIDVLSVKKFMQKPGRKIALAGGGGAIGVFSSDLAWRFGLDIPTFSPSTQALLQKYFDTPGNSVKNPLDTGTPVIPQDVMSNMSRIILKNEPVDVLVLVFLIRPLEQEVNNLTKMMGLEPPPPGSYLRSLKEVLAGLKEETGKEIALIFDNRAVRPEDVWVEEINRRVRAEFQALGIPVFPNTPRALKAISLSSPAE